MSSDFAAFVRSLGITPRREIAPDGRIHRCPTEDKPRSTNGAYMLSIDGAFGWAQDHAQHLEPVKWRPDRTTFLPPVRVDQAAARRAKERDDERRRRASVAAREFYRDCTPLLGGHAYLDAKGLTMEGCSGLRVDRAGHLVIPMCRGREIVSVQRIAPDGSKLFWSGAPKGGTTYVIDRRGAMLTVVCEGFATGAAVFAAVPGSRVVVCFDAGNLLKVAPAMPRRGVYVVAGDNDWETVCQPHKREGLVVPFSPWEDRPDWCRCNPGRCAGAEAARVLGCGCAYPDGIEGTDWLDYRVERVRLKLGTAVYGRRPPSEATVWRDVDGEIAMQIQRAARLVTMAS